MASLMSSDGELTPYLWVDDLSPITLFDRAGGAPGDPVNVPIAQALKDGLQLVSDLAAISVELVPTWLVELDRASILTVRSPSDTADQSFVWDLRLATPSGWREHARQLGMVLMMFGVGLHLDQPDRLYERLAVCSREGLLTCGLIPFAEPRT